MFNAVTYKEGVTQGQRVCWGLPLVRPPPQRGASGLSNPFLGVFSALKELEWKCCLLCRRPPAIRLSLWGSIPEVLLRLPAVRVSPARLVVPLQPAQSLHLPRCPHPLTLPALGGLRPKFTAGRGSPAPLAKAALGAWVLSLLPAAMSSPQAAWLCLQRGGGSGLGRIGGARGAGYRPNGPSPPPQDADGPAEAAEPRPL